MQQALCDELGELFHNKKFSGQEGRKALRIFKQNLPIDTGYDDDVDTDAAAAPYIVVLLSGGEVPDKSSPQTVEVMLTICCYDDGLEREGYQDVQNIKEDIIQHFCEKPWFGGAFTVQFPMSWAMQMDDTHPYYFGAVLMTCTAPTKTSEAVLEALL